MSDHKKEEFTLDVVSAIDDDVIEKNIKKRFELWFKRGKRNPRRWIPIVAAAACLCILISALALLVPGGNGKQVPVYRGMTVSNDAPTVEQAHAPLTYPTFSSLTAPAGPLPSYDISLLGDDDMPGQNNPNDDQDKDDAPGQNNPNDDQDKDDAPGQNNPNDDQDKDDAPGQNNPNDGHGKDDAPGQNKPNEDQGNYDNAPDIVFGQTYYALKNEDIYIYIHLSNPDEFEILSFTLNGKKYSSNMFEYGSDLETLILKYNVGDVDGLQEYTIDAIKYVDGEKIKDVRMEGDKTVKVFVNDEKDLLQFNAELSFMTLTIAPTKPLISLALYEGEELLRTLSPNDTEITDLPFDKRLILKATYSDGTRTREAQHIFDTQKLSQGLIIDAGGVIRGMGSCIDTELYINNPVGEEAFASIKSIVEVHMGPGVTSIGSKAFYECSVLSTVRLSDTLTELGSGAFSYSGVTSMTIPGSLTSLGSSAFANCEKLSQVTIAEGLTSIGEKAFCVCSALTDIHLPDSLTSIEANAFGSCSLLTDIHLPDSLTSIGASAFNSCSSLESITLPARITSIGERTFQDCSSLVSITLPSNLKTIGNRAFANCGALTNITLPEGVTSIGEQAFNNCLALTSLTLPNSLKELSGRYCFKTTGISHLVISGGLETIGEFAFNGTRNSPFETIVILDGVKRIEWAALADNDKLVKVVFPASITYLGKDIFSFCPKLSELYFEGTKAQWQSITKDLYWKGYSPITVVHCSDGDVSV